MNDLFRIAAISWIETEIQYTNIIQMFNKVRKTLENVLANKLTLPVQTVEGCDCYAAAARSEIESATS